MEENAPLPFICRIEGNEFGIAAREYGKYSVDSGTRKLTYWSFVVFPEKPVSV